MRTETTRADDVENSSDHYPICIYIDINIPQYVPCKWRNYQKTDIAKLQDFVRNNLGPIRELNNAISIEYATDYLVDVVKQGIKAFMPWMILSPFANPDFTPEC
jgi:hypothetical protein